MLELDSGMKKAIFFLGAAVAGASAFKQQGGARYALLAVAGIAIFQGMKNDEGAADKSLGAGKNDVQNKSNVNKTRVNSVTAQLNTALNSWGGYPNTARCNALKAFLALNDDEFVTVVNEYFKLTKTTIRQAISDLYTDGCDYGDNPDADILNRMDKLNLI